MKTTQPSLLAPVWQGALWGLGLLIITSIGIVSFRHFSPTPSETVHNAAEETGSDIAMLQQEIPTLYQGISGLQNELSGLQNEVSTLQSDTTLTEQLTELEQQIATLQSGFSTLQSGFSTLFPLGSFIAVNGTIDQATMNARGWALCDGSAINSQVKDAVLWGDTYNLAWRTLVGEGDYAKDTTISFPLGYVDIYTAKGKSQLGEVLHTLIEPEMPNHTHTIALKDSAGGSLTNGVEPMNGYTNSKDLLVSTKPAGGDQAHNNMPPFHVIQWYIKVK